ncbi:glycosyl hydrolase family 88 (plasmid) [Halostagnicola larsenii XH-48]|uniref:Glycosyl hydrolase family 88 n=1 Tax=Halostagnicola larsenii XH-48 TaxID=797299 RepID=W0JVL0_9EURY|nr:glycoside hydrolase family 88 protein [Halostagnicola larsenii]AHG01357.1 glycosyl hydrolase family 88 [Halostagnicola larsenii XH-48]
MPREPAAQVAGTADAGLPDRYAESTTVDRAALDQALSVAIDRIDDSLEEFYDRFPTPSSDDLTYGPTDNMDGWTASFWTGLCWLAYEVTGERRFRDAAETQLETFERRLERGDTETHDLGFLYTLSAVAGHRLTGSERYRSMALSAADLLAERFWEAPGLIQAWGDHEAEDESWERGRMIIDTMMNLPLLFWASEETGESRYAAIAETHARTNAHHIVRSDGSTYHTFKCDVESGAPIGGETAQGYDADSCWSRGQTWAIYGYAVAADYADEGAYAQLSAKLANYYLTHLEADSVPRWDFDAPADRNIRDTSAAAIAACGLDELGRQLPLADDRARGYRNAARTTLSSLAENYVAGADSNGLLTDGAYHTLDGDYDECCIWGDYFYVEGLVRATEHWSRYW